MKRKKLSAVKNEENNSNTRVTRSRRNGPQVLAAITPEPFKQEPKNDIMNSQSERSVSTSSNFSTNEESSSDTEEDSREDAQADANMLIKMEEAEESLKDGVDVAPSTETIPARYCDICKKQYSTERLFQNHIKYVHDPEYKLARELSQKNTDILPDEDDPDFNCRVCLRSFTCRSSYRNHLANIHKMTLTPRARVLQRTLIARFSDIFPDPEDPDFNCCVCQKNYSGKYNYRRHLRMVHKVKLKSLGSVQVVNPDAIPDPNDPNHYCPACERKFKDKSGYRSHIEVVHSVPPTRRQRVRVFSELPDANDPNNHCKVCNKSMKSKRSYRGHLRSIHLMHLEPISDRLIRIRNADKVPDENDPNNYCQVCEKSFNRRDSYRVHLKNIHSLTVKTQPRPGGIPYIMHPEVTPAENSPDNYCAACEKKLSNRTVYRRHLRVIHKMKLEPILPPSTTKLGVIPNIHDPRFFCCSCNKRYRTRAKYHKHLRHRHKAEINLEEILNFELSQHPDNLPEIDDPNFFCRVCKKKYPDRNRYRKHMRRSHHMELPSTRKPIRLRTDPSKIGLLPEVNNPNFHCRVCEKTYPNKNQYRKHLRSTHHMTLIPLNDMRLVNKEAEEEAEFNEKQEKLEVCGICRKGFTHGDLYFHQCKGSPKKEVSRTQSETTREELPHHQQTNHQNQKETTTSNAVVIIPDENDPDFYCNLCKMKSPDRHTFHNHLELTHKMKLVNRSKESITVEVPPEDLSDPLDPNFYCKVCDKKLKTKDVFLGHLRMKHKMKFRFTTRGPHPIPYPGLTPDVNDPNLYCCACEKKFVCRSTYRSHLTHIHHMELKPSRAMRIKGQFICAYPNLKPDVDDLNFYCRACNRGYGKWSSYRGHLITVHDMNIGPKSRAFYLKRRGLRVDKNITKESLKAVAEREALQNPKPVVQSTSNNSTRRYRHPRSAQPK